MKTLVVKQPFPYAGVKRKVGDRIEATNSHATVLCISGKTRELTEEEKQLLPTARRDMRAENETGNSTLSLPNNRGRSGRKRGEYLRSDMRAEK